MKYSVTNDKRTNLENILFVISCLLCVALEIFVLSKIKFGNETLNVIWIIFQCAVTISPLGIVALIKIILYNQLLKWLGIPNLSGEYFIECKSNYKKHEITHARIEIKQTFDTITICYLSDNSKSCAVSAKIDNISGNPVLYYLYTNEGNGLDDKNQAHVGTSVLTFINNTIDGYYYSNRNTHGTIKSCEKINKS